MSEQRPALHMWALVPPTPLVLRIEDLRQEISRRFQCYKALRPPVHLTLYKPFSTSDELVSRSIGELKNWLAGQPGVSLTLKDFGLFERSKHPVLFIDVLPSFVLSALHAGLSRETIRTFELPTDRAAQSGFHPHFTLAYRDLLPRHLPELRQMCREARFDDGFEARTVCLFRHNGRRWELLHECPLRTMDE